LTCAPVLARVQGKDTGMMLEEPAGGAAANAAAQGVGAAAAGIAEQVALVNRQAATIQNSASSFASSAGSGFHIEPEAAATLIKACNESLRELVQLQNHLTTLDQAPKLGRTPGAQVVAPYAQRAATDAQGIRPAITNLQHTLQSMVQAYQKASTNYQETEAIIAQAARQNQANLS
jgi:hypothetical protein